MRKKLQKRDLARGGGNTLDNLGKPKELKRVQLEAVFSEIVNKPLAIVAAPSGYGKTTLVQSFFQKDPELRYIWLSLGQEAVDEIWIWSRFCEKFSGFDIQEQLYQLGLPETAQEIDYFIAFVRENLREPMYVVFDDYHECSSQRMQKLIEKLTYEEISWLHIILISRIYPELPYEEMMLRGYCVLVDQTLLTLSHEEIVEIFRINGAGLTEEETDTLCEYTDGWISAVYLALYNYKRSGSFGNFSGISHLLKTAIYDKLSLSLQQMCMMMSLFEDFTLEGAHYVTRLDIPPMALADFMERCGFIHYDTKTKRYRMHSLFRFVAQTELEKTGMDKKAILERGGDWCDKRGNYVKAMINYRNAGKNEKIFQMLSGKYRDVIFEVAPAIVEGIFDEAPLEIKGKYPKAWLGYIYYMIVKEEMEKGETLFEEARNYYLERYDLDGRYNELKGELLIIEALLQFNDLEKINALMEEAYKLLGRKPSAIFRQSLLTYGSTLMTFLYYNKAGNLKRVVELEKEYARYHIRLRGDGEGNWDEFFDAEYSFMTADIKKAYELSLLSYKKAMFRDQICIVISSYYIRLRSLIYMGDEAGFARTMRELQRDMKDVVRPVLVMAADLVYSYAFACIGRNDMVADWIKDFHLENCNRMLRNVRSGCSVYGIVLTKNRQWALLDALADQMLVPYESTVHMESYIRGYIFKAIAAAHLTDMFQAWGYLFKAIEIAEKDEVRIPFIENCDEILPVLESSMCHNKFCDSLKPHIRQYQHSMKLFDKEAGKVALTAREQELMHYVRAGFRNVDISEKMGIALVTVEKNLTSIYRKLNVSNRAAAIAKMEKIL